MKKWTEGAVAGIYRVVLPMVNKKNIILIYSVGDIQKSVGNFWILHQHF